MAKIQLIGIFYLGGHSVIICNVGIQSWEYFVLVGILSLLYVSWAFSHGNIMSWWAFCHYYIYRGHLVMGILCPHGHFVIKVILSMGILSKRYLVRGQNTLQGIMTINHYPLFQQYLWLLTTASLKQGLTTIFLI